MSGDGERWKMRVFAASVPVAEEMAKAIMDTQAEATTCGRCDWSRLKEGKNTRGVCEYPLPFWVTDGGGEVSLEIPISCPAWKEKEAP